jgi:hypothetical protein
MPFNFLDPKTIYLIVHVFGAILGAGGAFASDAMFFSSVKDGKFTSEELRFMKLGSRLVWSGIVLLVVSGILLVSMDPTGYLASDKFLAKLTIVIVIVINGIIFHTLHIPHLKKNLGIVFRESPTFIKRAPLILASGALSMVSWISTVILGMIKVFPYTYSQIMGMYLVIAAIAMMGAVLMKKVILKL